jgi:hypothetical protein
MGTLAELAMQGGLVSSRDWSRRAVSRQAAALGAAAILIVAGVMGYLFVLRPGSSSTPSPSTPGGVAGGVGSAQDNPVSAFALYDDYNLGGTAIDYPQFTNHLVYAKGNIVSIVRDPKAHMLETQLATGRDAFEFWEWTNSTVLPLIADNQLVLAHCHVRGLVPSQNGTDYLYLDSCNLISISG